MALRLRLALAVFSRLCLWDSRKSASALGTAATAWTKASKEGSEADCFAMGLVYHAVITHGPTREVGKLERLFVLCIEHRYLIPVDRYKN